MWNRLDAHCAGRSWLGMRAGKLKKLARTGFSPSARVITFMSETLNNVPSGQESVVFKRKSRENRRRRLVRERKDACDAS